MEYRNDLTAEYVRSLFDFDGENLYWKRRKDASPQWNGKWAGKLAGWQDRHGYWYVGIHNKNYAVSRIIWLYVHGEWPSELVDHKEMTIDRNNVENLRSANKSLNGANSKPKGETGLKGVRINRQGKYVARIRAKGKEIHLITTECPAVASFAYQMAADIAFGEFARWV